MKRMAQPMVLFLCLLLFWSAHLTAQNEFKRQVVDLETEDGTRLWALLYTNSTPNPSTGVIIMHLKQIKEVTIPTLFICAARPTGRSIPASGRP